MKSLSALVFALLVGLFLASPASAELRTNGRMSLDFSLERIPATEGWTRRISTHLGLNGEFFPGDRDNARVVVQTSGRTTSMSNSEELSIFPQNLTVQSSFLELTTAMWAGGPQWLLRMGDQSVSWSPLIQPPMDRKGITLSNVNIGNVNTRWAYLWGGSGELATAGVIASTRLGGWTLTGTYVDNTIRPQFALEGATLLLGGLVEVQGGFSIDDGKFNMARAVLGWDPFPGWSLSARYVNGRSFLDPAQRDDDAQLSVSTMQFGTQISAGVQVRNGEMGGASLNAQRPFIILGHVFRASYGARLSGGQVSHSLSAQTSVNLGVFKGVGLGATINKFDDSTWWQAQLSYSTPGGPSFNMQFDQSQKTTFRTGVGVNF